MSTEPDPVFKLFVNELVYRLEKSKFKVWRHVSWGEHDELPLLAFRDVVFPLSQCQCFFVREVDVASVELFKTLNSDCLTYIQRTKPKIWGNPYLAQYLTIMCVVADKFDDETLEFVKQGRLPRQWRWTSDMPFPVLLNKSTRSVHYYTGWGFAGGAIYPILRGLVRTYVEPAWKRQ